jgi:hypothetical protein
MEYVNPIPLSFPLLLLLFLKNTLTIAASPVRDMAVCNVVSVGNCSNCDTSNLESKEKEKKAQ